MEEDTQHDEFTAYRATHRSTAGRLARRLAAKERSGASRVHPSLRNAILDAASEAAVSILGDGDIQNFETFLTYCERFISSPNECDHGKKNMGRPDLVPSVRPALSYLLDPFEPGTVVDEAKGADTATRTGTLRMDLGMHIGLLFFWEDGTYWVAAENLE